MNQPSKNLLLLLERNPIHITFTEDDRQKADAYISNRYCLIATAAKRVGLKDPLVGAGFVESELGCYEIDRIIVSDYTHSRGEHPWYEPEIVGQSITLLPWPPIATLQ